MCFTVDLVSFTGRKVAIDASMSLYQFLIAVRTSDGVLTSSDGETTRYVHVHVCVPQQKQAWSVDIISTVLMKLGTYTMCIRVRGYYMLCISHIHLVT